MARLPRSTTAERPAEAGFLVVEGKELPYVVKWSSKRRRSYGFVVDREGKVCFSAPRWVRVDELVRFAQRRKRFIFNRLAELEARREKHAERAELSKISCPLPDTWYRRASKQVMAPRVRHWAARVGVSVGAIRITSGRTVWGSCNSRGDISLSWRLLLVPEDVREYVIVHEVCHRRHMNHGVRFWALVEKHVPDYLEKRRRLAKMGAEAA